VAKQRWWRRLIDGREPVFPQDEPAPATEHEPTLEAEIARDPDAIDPYLIYADWLHDHGDPRGTLIALQAACEERVDDTRWDSNVRTLDPWTVLAGKPAAAAQEQLARFPIRLGGDLEPGDHVEWHCGYWRRLHLEPAPVKTATFTLETRLASALGHESARFLRTLSIGANYGLPVPERLPELPVSLRTLHLGAGVRSRLAPLDPIDPLWPRARKLETIVLEGLRVKLARGFEAPALRSLEIVTEELDPQTLLSIAASELPVLETLIVWIDAPRRHITPGDVRVLTRATLPSLRDLGLVNCRFADEALEAVIDAPWFPQLRVLDLSRGRLTERGIAILERVRDRLPELQYLDVSRNVLDDAACARARALAPKVRTIKQLK